MLQIHHLIRNIYLLLLCTRGDMGFFCFGDIDLSSIVLSYRSELISEFRALLRFVLLMLWSSSSRHLLLSLLRIASLITLIGLFSRSESVVRLRGLKLIMPRNGLLVLRSFVGLKVLCKSSYSNSNLEVGVESKLNFALCPSHLSLSKALQDSQSFSLPMNLSYAVEARPLVLCS